MQFRLIGEGVGECVVEMDAMARRLNGVVFMPLLA